MLNTQNDDGTDAEQSSELFYQLAYCSVLKQQLDPIAVQEIVAHAKSNNIKNDVSGMLMIEQGLVIQWLEGKEATVRKLWAKLQVDPRHHCIVELMHNDFARERLFPDWAMHRTTRGEMLAIVHDARRQAERGKPTPWDGAIATLCILIDPNYAKSYGAALQTQESAEPAVQAESKDD